MLTLTNENVFCSVSDDRGRKLESGAEGKRGFEVSRLPTVWGCGRCHHGDSVLGERVTPHQDIAALQVLLFSFPPPLYFELNKVLGFSVSLILIMYWKCDNKNHLTKNRLAPECPRKAYYPRGLTVSEEPGQLHRQALLSVQRVFLYSCGRRVPWPPRATPPPPVCAWK